MAFFALVLVGFVVLAIVCIFLVRHYKAPSVTLDVIIAVYFSWVLGFAGILLLPYDMSEALLGNEKSPTLNYIWHSIYWITFALAWGILPIQMSYHTSGGFTFRAKLWEAFYQNVLFYVVAGIVAIIYVAYKVASGAGSASEVVGFMMAMGNTYGVLLIIVLMGNGLVALPRRLWQLGSAENELIRIYLMAPNVESAFCEAKFELEDCEDEVKRLANSSESDREIEGLALIIQEQVSTFSYAGRSNTLHYTRAVTKEKVKTTPSTKKGLVGLNKRVIQAQLKVLACDCRWRNLLSRARRLENLVNGSLSPEEASWCEMQTSIDHSPPHTICKPFRQCHDQMKLTWRVHIFRHVCRLAASICAVASAVILWSELVMGSHLKSPIGYLLLSTTAAKKFVNEDNSSFLVQIIIFVALCYMSLCTYWSLFRINISWSYTLQGPHLSPPTSLLFNAMYFSRLQFCIGYNFLLFLNVSQLYNASFFADLMKNLQIIPQLGRSFAVYAPIITFIVGLFTLFNGWGRLLKLLGIDHEDAVSTSVCFCQKMASDDEEKMDEGKKLIAGQLRLLSTASSSTSTESSTSYSTPLTRGGVDTASAMKALNGSSTSGMTATSTGTTKNGLSSNHVSASDKMYRDDDQNSDDDLEEGPRNGKGVATKSPLYSTSSAVGGVSSSHPSHSSRIEMTPPSTTNSSGHHSLPLPGLGPPLVPGTTGTGTGKTYTGRYARVDLDSSGSTGGSAATISASTATATDTLKSDLFAGKTGTDSSNILNNSEGGGKVYGGRYSRNK